MSPNAAPTVPFPAPHCALCTPPRRLAVEGRMVSGGARGAAGGDCSSQAGVAASTARGPRLCGRHGVPHRI